MEVATGEANKFRTMLLVVYRGYGHLIAPAYGDPDSPPEATKTGLVHRNKKEKEQTRISSYVIRVCLSKLLAAVRSAISVPPY